MADLFDFIKWAENTKAIPRRVLKKVEKEANYYIAYLSWLSLHPDQIDNEKTRSRWYRVQNKRILFHSLKHNGF